MAGGETQGRCPFCSTAVKTANLPRHLRTVHPGDPDALRRAKEVESQLRKGSRRTRQTRFRRRRLDSRIVAGLVAIAVIVAGLYVYFVYTRGPNPNLTRDVLEICYDSEKFTVHRHAQLNITVNNNSRPIQPSVGVPEDQGGRAPSGCWRPLHTHNDSGIVHIESDVARNWTLGDFFKVWGEDYKPANPRISRTTLAIGLDVKTVPGPYGNATLVILVDGRQVDAYDDLVLAPIDEGLGEASPVHRVQVKYDGP